MLTVKRLYLYGVLGAALVPLLWGLSNLLWLTLRGAAAALDSREVVGADVIRDELSAAVALVVVALPIWALHLWLVRRSLRGSPEAVAEERACSARSTYFFLVLIATGIVACLHLFEIVQTVVGVALIDERPRGAAREVAMVVVAGSAWLAHIAWRRADLNAAPARTAGDWLTRAYLYGPLFLLAVAAAYWYGVMGSVFVGEAVGASTFLGGEDRWQAAIVSPVAGAVAASVGWLLQWSFAAYLLRAAPPMGEAHRASRTRTGYFLAVVLVSATAVLVLTATGTRHVLAEVLGAWRPTDGSRLADDVGGPLVVAVSFAVAWWWHGRRSTSEALAFGGRPRWLSVGRSGRLVIALVGLAGLTIGLWWVVYALLEYIELSGGSLLRSHDLRDHVTPALATAIIGLVMWAPTWVRSQRDRVRHPLAIAESTARRAYLLLVSGLAVIAVMGSLAYLVYQATRLLLDAGPVGDTSWAISMLAVAAIVLTYHLLQLRADAAVVAVATEAEPSPPTAAEGERAVETIEISAPIGSDFESLNASVRENLPEGFEMRIV